MTGSWDTNEQVLIARVFLLDVMVPLQGVNRPANSFKKIVFPAPLAPSKTVIPSPLKERLVFCKRAFPSTLKDRSRMVI
jgi:hypothetical protein